MIKKLFYWEAVCFLNNISCRELAKQGDINYNSMLRWKFNTFDKKINRFPRYSSIIALSEGLSKMTGLDIPQEELFNVVEIGLVTKKSKPDQENWI